MVWLKIGVNCSSEIWRDSRCLFTKPTAKLLQSWWWRCESRVVETIFVPVRDCKPKKIRLAIRNNWNGPTNDILCPLIYETVNSPGRVRSERKLRIKRRSTELKAWRNWTNSPRKVRSRITGVFSPQVEQKEVRSVVRQLGQIHDSSTDFLFFFDCLDFRNLRFRAQHILYQNNKN